MSGHWFPLENNMKNFIWFEKHRPTSLGEMILPLKYHKKFESYIKKKEIPHLLLIGKPGSGKTTVAQILIRAIKCQALELNASSKDRGVETIKTKVSDFASSQAVNKGEIKIVFLDEADGLTRDAQLAMKNTMEKYSSLTRFILTANNPDSIQEAIQSRCTPYTFTQFSKDDTLEYLVDILDEEEIEFDEDDIEKVIDRFYPDIRSLVNQIQFASADGEFNLEDILSTMIDVKEVGGFLNKGKIKKIRETVSSVQNFTFLYQYLFNEWAQTQFLDEERFDASIIIADYLHKDSTIADKEINFTACCMDLILLKEEK